jgi:hypothetical protein
VSLNRNPCKTRLAIDLSVKLFLKNVKKKPEKTPSGHKE